MQNLTQGAITIADATIPATGDPAFIETLPQGETFVELGGQSWPVQNLRLGKLPNLPQQPTLVPLPTALAMAARGKLPNSALVAYDEKRDSSGAIQSYRALARVRVAGSASQAGGTFTTQPNQVRAVVPHELNLMQDGKVLTSVASSGSGRRSETAGKATRTVTVNGTEIPVYDVTYGAPEGLPNPKPGVLNVVSLPSLMGSPRGDLIAPDTVLKDGKPVGAKGFKRLL